MTAPLPVSRTGATDREVEAHRMLPGSHERSSGPECRCGAAWDYWGDHCAALLAEQPGGGK